LCIFNEFVDHEGHQGNTAHALAQWQHPVASHEALDVLHWAMHPTSHRRTRMVTKIASDSPAFFVFADYLFAHNLVYHVMVNINKNQVRLLFIALMNLIVYVIGPRRQ
jgi:TRAP-type mannitol/chloroaromatic compound transport system permease large subunit